MIRVRLFELFTLRLLRRSRPPRPLTKVRKGQPGSLPRTRALGSSRETGAGLIRWSFRSRTPKGRTVRNQGVVLALRQALRMKTIP